MMYIVYINAMAMQYFIYTPCARCSVGWCGCVDEFVNYKVLCVVVFFRIRLYFFHVRVDLDKV